MSKKEITYKIIIDDEGNTRKLEEMSQSADDVTSAVKRLDSGFEALAGRVSDAISKAVSNSAALDKTRSSATGLAKAQQELLAIQDNLQAANIKDVDTLNRLKGQYEELRLQIEQMKNSGQDPGMYTSLEGEFNNLKNSIFEAEQAINQSQSAYSEFAHQTSEAINQVEAEEIEKSTWTKKLTEEERALRQMSLSEFQALVEQERAERGKQKVSISEVAQELVSKSQMRASAEKLSSQQVIEAIAAQRIAVRALEKDVNAGNVARQNELGNERAMLQILEQVNAEKFKFMTQQRSIEGAIGMEMQLNGKNTEMYRELVQILRSVGTQYREVNKLRTQESSGGSQWAGVISGVQGLVGAYTAANGVISLFVTNQEKLQKVQTHLQSTMAILMGMQQLANTLHSTSAFRVTTVAKVTDFLTAANMRLATSLGISTAAAQTLMATLTLGLSVVIAGVVSAISGLVKRQKEHAELMKLEAEKQKEYAQNIADNASKQIVTYKKLQNEWIALKGEYEKNQWIKTNASEFDKLGVSITSIIDAEIIFISNEQQFIDTIRSRAVAAASMDLAAEKYKQAIEKMVEADNYKPTKADIKAANREADNKVAKQQIYSMFAWGGEEFRENAFKEALDSIVTQRKKDYITVAEALEKEGDAFLAAGAKSNQKVIDGINNLKLQPSGKNKNNELLDAQEEYNKWLINTANKASEELVKIEMDRQKKIIGTMEDGYAKQMAQIRFNEAQKLIEIRKYVQEYVDSAAKLKKNEGATVDYGVFTKGPDGQWSLQIAENALQLTPEVAAVVNEKLSDLGQLINDGLDDIINRQVRVDDKVMKSAALSFGDNVEQMVSALLQNIDAETIAYTSSFDLLKSQASIIFADISELSADMIRKIIANAEEYIASGKVSDEALAQFRQAIDKANEYLVKKNPWSAIKVAQERYAKAIKDYNDAQGQTDPVQRIKAQNQAILDQAAALAIIRQAYEEIVNIINDVVGVFGEFAKAAGIDENVASSVENLIGKFSTLLIESGLLAKALIKVAEASGEAGKAFADAAKEIGDGTSTAGMIGAMIGAYSAIVQVIQAVESAKEAAVSAAADEYLDRVNSQLDKLHEKLEKIASLSDLSRSWFGADTFADIKDIYNAFAYQENVLDRLFNNVISKYKATYDSYMKLWTKLMKEGKLSKKEQGQMLDLEFGAEIYSQFSKIQKALGETGFNLEGGFNLVDVVSVQEQISALEELYSILQKGGDELAELAGDVLLTKEALELYVDYYDKLKESVESLVGDISGNILSTVNSMWKEIREGGETTFEDLADAAKKNISGVIDQMVSQQLWATYMSGYFDQLGEGLTNAIIQGGDTGALMDVFDSFWSGMEQGLVDYTSAYETFLQSAEQRDWDMGTGKADASAPKGSIKAMREELSKLQEQWENLIPEEREGAVGKQVSGDIEDLEEKISLAENLYNTKAIESLIQQQERLNSLYQEWVKMYGQLAADEMLAGLGANPDDYIKALEARRDELQAITELSAEQQEELANILSKINSIYDAAYSASAEASREAFEVWSESLTDSLDNASSQYEQLAAYQAAYLIALNDTVMSEEDRAKALENAAKNAEDLSRQITQDLRDKYRTPEEQREIDISGFREDLEWANVQGLPDLAANIRAAWDAYILDEWEESFRGLKESADSSIKYLELLRKERDALINSGLEGGALEGAGIIIDEEIAATEKEILQDLLEKFKIAEQQRIDLIREYTEYEAFLRERGYALQADAVADELNKQLSDLDQAAIEASGLWKELTGDTSDMSEEAILAMLANVRGMIDQADDLTDEARDQLLSKVDQVENDLKARKWDEAINTINDIATALSALNDALQKTGVLSSESAAGLGEIISALGNVGSILTGIVSKNYVAIFTGAISLVAELFSLLDINGRKVDKQQKTISRNLTELKDLYNDLDRAVNKVIGTETYEKQLELIENLRQQQEALHEMVSSESSRKNPDEDLIATYQQEIQTIQNNIEDVYEAMSSELLRTNVKTLAGNISDILSDMTATTEQKLNSVKKTAQDVVRDVLRYWLQLRYLESPIKAALAAMEEEMLANGPTKEMADKFYAEAERIAKEYNDVFGGYASFFPSITAVSDNQIASAWRSMSEEAGNAAVGQLTRIAINGVQSIDLQKAQIEGLNIVSESIRDMAIDVKMIASNTGLLLNIEKLLRDKNKSIGL